MEAAAALNEPLIGTYSDSRQKAELFECLGNEVAKPGAAGQFILSWLEAARDASTSGFAADAIDRVSMAAWRDAA
jgi:hypothetical protein